MWKDRRPGIWGSIALAEEETELRRRAGPRRPVRRRKPPGRFWRRGPPVLPRVGGASFWSEPSSCPPCPPCETKPADEPVADEPSDAPQEETRVGRGALDANLEWQRVALDRYPVRGLPATGGVYIVVRGNLPIYVGETASFAQRWNGRMLGLYQLGLVPALANSGVPPVIVYLGTLTPNTPSARAIAEHLVIRLLDEASIAPAKGLRNQQSTRKFRVLGRIELRNVLPKAIAGLATRQIPQLKRNTVTLLPEATKVFELYREFEP